MITLVLGGARSGKSRVAERIATEHGTPITYVATASLASGDRDHAARIAAHRARRPADWSTVEVVTELAQVLRDLEGTALVDSLGTWVTSSPDFVVDAGALCSALAGRAGDTVIVSEEVGLGVHPSSELGRQFRDALGDVNAAVAEVADDVLLVVAGRVLRLDRF